MAISVKITLAIFRVSAKESPRKGAFRKFLDAIVGRTHPPHEGIGQGDIRNGAKKSDVARAIPAKALFQKRPNRNSRDAYGPETPPTCFEIA